MVFPPGKSAGQWPEKGIAPLGLETVNPSGP